MGTWLLALPLPGCGLECPHLSGLCLPISEMGPVSPAHPPRGALRPGFEPPRGPTVRFGVPSTLPHLPGAPGGGERRGARLGTSILTR